MDTNRTTTEIAQRRIAALKTEAEYYDRRDALRRDLEEGGGLTPVALTMLRLLEEECVGIDADRDAEQASEIAAENAWLRDAEYGRYEGVPEWAL